METFEFSTPTLDTRDPQTLTVDFAGQHTRVDRPKDWVLSNFATIFADDVPHDRRAQAVLRYMLGVLGEDGYEQLLHRSVDLTDPLDLAGLLNFIAQTWNRWSEFHPGNNPPITVTNPPRTSSNQPLRLVNADLDLDVIAQPPKDLVLMIVAATATRSSGAGHRWAIEYFLEATFPEDAFLTLNARLNAAHDPLDIVHLEPMITKLIERWTDNMEIPTLDDLQPTGPGNTGNGGQHHRAVGEDSGQWHQDPRTGEITRRTGSLDDPYASTNKLQHVNYGYTAPHQQ